MSEMPISQFKAQCLRVVDQVADTREVVILTRHGKRVAKIVPLDPEEDSKSLLGSVTELEDIVEPIDEAWNADA